MLEINFDENATNQNHFTMDLVKEIHINGFKEVKYLFHSKALQDSKKNMEAFNYSKILNYGAGIYFTDMIDYISFFNGRNNNNKTLPINSTFSAIYPGNTPHPHGWSPIR